MGEKKKGEKKKGRETLRGWGFAFGTGLYYWPTQSTKLLSPLTKAYNLDVRPTADGAKILGVPLGSPGFVENFIRKKFDAIDASLALAATIPDARIAHNIHHVTASACRMTHLLRLIPSADAMTL